MPHFLWECNRRDEEAPHFVSGFFHFFQIIVTNGDPLELSTQVRYLFIRGQLASTNNLHQALYEKDSKRPKSAN